MDLGSRFLNCLLPAVSLFLLLTSCAPPQIPTAAAPSAFEELPTITPMPFVWPSRQWPVSPAEEQGLDAAQLDGIVRSLELGTYGYIDRFLLILDGELVLDETFEHDYAEINANRDTTSHPYNYYSSDWHPYLQGTDLHTLQSVTKSVTSLLVGIAVDRGDLPGTGTPIMDYFNEYEIQDLDEDKALITIDDLLTMRSGLDWKEWEYPLDDPRNITIQMENSEDWIQFVLDRPMAYEPGEEWAYSSGVSQLLSVILKEATGVTIDEYAEEHLFHPLGIKEYYWKRTPQGWPDTEGGLYLRAEDLARIGYLILRNGVWEGEPVVSEEWIARATTPIVLDIFPEDPFWDWNYGYMWWTIDVNNAEMPEIIFAAGYGGQYLYLVPELDLVVVFNAWDIYSDSASLMDLVIQRLLPILE